MFLLVRCQISPSKKIDSIHQIPEINSFVNDSIRTDQNSTFFSVSSGTAKLFTETFRKESKFYISWDENKQIDYILTHDPNFKTKEGVHVNMELKDLMVIQNTNFKKIVDRAYVMQLESGWYASFPISKKGISKNDSITCLYKKTKEIYY